ncbi:MAG: response regulator [Caulobacteraceae bacterium]|nr:response regulator [Caulobacteraceae bacterium]
MSDAASDFGRLYVTALGAHLRQSGEPALHQAYELGRRALADGLGVLDISLLHHDAMARVLIEQKTAVSDKRLMLASEFLAECLSPFEMSLRGYQEANERLTIAHEKLKIEIEERRKAEEALLHAKKLQAIGLLAGGVAHHFNNALMVVMGNLDLARRRVAGDERASRLLQAARRGAERGAEVTRQLLSFSRQQMLQPRLIDPRTWLAEIEPLLSGALRGDIQFETAVVGDPPPVLADPSQLELAILNLALNARDAMPSGGVLRITVSTRAVDDGLLGLAGDFVIFEVADTGVGVPPEVLPRVFEPFFTTKDGGPGAGLGLSQAHGFAHQSGGAAEIESQSGEGTRVRLYLPASSGVVAPRQVSPSMGSKPARTGRVLVVEDDQDVADLTRDLLQSLGYSVKLAYRAQAALDLIGEGEPVDLVFSDVIMPGGMSGMQLAAELRQRFPQLPVLLTSGYNDAIEQLEQAPAADEPVTFIPKPYRTEELDHRIAELLGARG